MYGNAGSGKTTVAVALSRAHGIPHLDLDSIAWADGAQRRPLADSVADLRRFIETNPGWVIEGCYGDLVQAALPWCTQLRFLNPGVGACLQRCRARAWEPHKFRSREEQDRMLESLLDWVRQYETRNDEFSLARHRAIFRDFRGDKREYGEHDSPVD